MLGAWIVLYLIECLYRWLASVCLWRLRRDILAVLLAAATVTTIIAQKDRIGGVGTTGISPVTVPQTETTGVSPVASEGTNTFHLADIKVGTNTVTLAIAWPSGFFDVGTTIDLLAATSLVNAVWAWQSGHTVATGETNWTETVAATGGSCFYKAVVRDSLTDMDDPDGDGLPNAYELAYGKNPWLADSGTVPRLTVGGGGQFATLEAAFEESEAYSIVSLTSGVYQVNRDIQMPPHPVMVTCEDGYAVFSGATSRATFLLGSGHESGHTLFRNLYLNLTSTNGMQAGFWCGGGLPWQGPGAAAAFENVHIRAPNPGVEYFGWLFYGHCDASAVIRGCCVNASGAEWIYAVLGDNPPPIVVESCTFVNFSSPSPRQRAAIGLRSTQADGAVSAMPTVTVSRVLFDVSFTNAWPLARFENADDFPVEMTDCIRPSEPASPDFMPDVTGNVHVATSQVTWAGFPLADSPAALLGIGAFSLLPDDPDADMDGDGLSDYVEAYGHGTDPFLADTDNDGVPDAVEILEDGTDPSDPHSFKQRLTVTVTNTASTAYLVRMAWGCSDTGWETNGLASFQQGFGETAYTNIAAQGATCAKAYCDLNGNGEYDADDDILLVRPIPLGSNARLVLAFGDVDGDGVADRQERTDGTDPYDSDNLRIRRIIEVSNSDFGSGVTNIIAITDGASHWEPDCIVTSFTGYGVSYELDINVTNRYAYVKCLRDFAGNEDIDSSTNVLYTVNLGRSSSDNLRYAFLIGDRDNDGVSDSDEMNEGTDSRKGSAYCICLNATISRIFVPSNGLSAVAYFGADTNILYGPCTLSNSVLAVDFGHLSTISREKVVFHFWEDIDGNGTRNAGERQSVLALPVVGHSMCVTNMMPLGEFDADNDGMPDDWERQHGLSPSGAADAMGDADGDGFMNLHEYWAGTDPNDAADDGAGTALYATTHAVDDRIADRVGNVAAAKKIYENYSINMFNTNQVRNADCWIADIDITCSSIWNDDPGYHYGDCATLITPQHVVLAAHLGSPIGRGYIFRATNGTTTVRRLVDKLRIGSTDITVGLLESPLPAEYTPAKLLPPDYDHHLGTGRLVPVCHQNKYRQAFVVELPDLSTWMTHGEIYMNYGSTSPRYMFKEAVWGHDSGNPCFMLADGQRILLYATHVRQNANGAPGGPHTALYAREIQSAIDTMSDRAAMPRRTLQFFDFSPFAELHEGGAQ